MGQAQNHNKNLWFRWLKNNPSSSKKIDHQLFQVFLDTYLQKPKEGLALVDYQHVNIKTRKQLQTYLNAMSHISISQYNRKEQLAYWLNVYNALVINTILKHYPISSIQKINISPGLFSQGPWEAKLMTIENTPLSLNDIKDRIVRPIWNNERTLYAMNDGSIGAPNLYKTVFKSTMLEAQLNQQTRDYINCMRGVQVIQGKLVASELYQWYEQDFGHDKQAVIQHLKLYASPALLKQLDTIQTIDTYTYNWHLNTSVIQ